MSYTLREHTADIAVEATAPTLAALFESVGDGLTAASCETIAEGGDRFEFTVTAESREALLFDYLDQLIYERDVRLVLPADHRCTIAESDDPESDDSESNDEAMWTVEVTARGVPSTPSPPGRSRLSPTPRWSSIVGAASGTRTSFSTCDERTRPKTNARGNHYHRRDPCWHMSQSGWDDTDAGAETGADGPAEREPSGTEERQPEATARGAPRRSADTGLRAP